MERLKRLRNKIDASDKEILRLLNKRADITLKIGRLKQQKGRPIFSPGRETYVYERLVKANRGPLTDETIKAIYREIMSGSLQLEKPLCIAYFGPEATFTHIAALKKFGKSVKYSECESIADVFTEVERDRADYGVVPIENSTEGAVNHTLDMFVDSELKICSESYLRIEHNLLSRLKKLSSVRHVYSHQQVFAQCRKWLERKLPGAKLVAVTSTTTAAELAGNGKNCAAIASMLAAERYSLNILAASIEDSPHNITRFLVIGKQETAPTKSDKTSIVFSMKDKAGALHDVLTPFKKAGVNLTKIESRPSKKKAWRYYFFLDMQGHHKDARINKALRSLSRHCVYMKVLGSYPVAG